MFSILFTDAGGSLVAKSPISILNVIIKKEIYVICNEVPFMARQLLEQFNKRILMKLLLPILLAMGGTKNNG